MEIHGRFALQIVFFRKRLIENVILLLNQIHAADTAFAGNAVEQKNRLGTILAET